jgi:hypothetical protein
MGVMIHDTVIVLVSGYVLKDPQENGYPDLAKFLKEMPQGLRPLVVGPIQAVEGGDVSFFWAPDGSKEGWDTSNLADEWREKFIQLFSFAYDDGSSPYDVLHVRFGPDLRGNYLPSELHEPVRCTCGNEALENLGYRDHLEGCPQKGRNKELTA